jgi:hypothetical protein
MNMKTVATWSPMLLCLVAGAARADLEPFSFDASETIKHQSNILHSESSDHKADWLSTTELKAALDKVIGRERLLGTAAVNTDRYDSLSRRDSIGYTGTAELEWSTIGDISGAFGADARRHQYLYGLDGDRSSTSKNLQTDNHAFARLQVGGLARWSIFAGLDASQRKYSDPLFDVNESRQWAVSGGTSYQTSPDLAFGLNGRYIRGKYPHAPLSDGDEQTFSVKTVGAHTKWTASGNSSFDANIGYTQQRNDGQPDQHYLNGGLNWRWTPPSHFAFNLGVLRDGSTSAGSGATIVNTNNSINGRSLNTSAHLDVSYALTAKVTLDALAEYIHRKYTDAQIAIPTGFTDINGAPVFVLTPVSGSNNTSRFTLSAHYTPTRTTNVGCGVSREVHTADTSISAISAPYTDNTVQCMASIHFD